MGDPITVTVSDDFSVAGVNVQIHTQLNELIEQGSAVETPANSGHWVYAATVQVPGSTTLTIKAVATDRPGGMGIRSHTLTV